MPKPYKVQPGEWLSKIALKHGFTDGGEAIWKANPDLEKKTGGNRELLAEGWIITIPDKVQKQISSGTGSLHSFQIGSFAKNLRITLLDPDGKGVGDWEYLARIEGKLLKGKSGADGKIVFEHIPQTLDKIEVEVRETTLFGKWKFDPEKIVLHLGSLEPILEGDAGKKTIQKILKNLGLYSGTVDGKFGPKTRAALQAFQTKEKIPVTGQADEETCKHLIKAQGNSMPPPKAPEKAGAGAGQPADSSGNRAASLTQGDAAKQETEKVTTFSEYQEPTTGGPGGGSGTDAGGATSLASTLITVAEKYIGTREEGGANKGAQVEEFQKAVDGNSVGESWCLAFVQYCVKETDKQTGAKNQLFQTEHCMTLWSKTPEDAKLADPVPGCVVLWQHYKDGAATSQGHAGIVTKILGPNKIETIEGNTGSGEAVNREGDGVYRRERSKTGGGSMLVKGFLRAWPANAAAPLLTAQSPAGAGVDRAKREKLGRFHFFPHEAHVLPCDPGDDAKNPNPIRMPARKFLFLDCGHWQEDKGKFRFFGLIWGRHAYLCEYDPDGTGAASVSEKGLDADFFKAMGGKVKIKQHGSAAWAPDEDFDWKKLYLVVPDLHLMTGAIGSRWKQASGSLGYDLQAELDLLRFARDLVGLSFLKDHLHVVQIGDTYDLWVGAQEYGLDDKTPLFTENTHLEMQLREPRKPVVAFLHSWIDDIRGLNTNWVQEIFRRRGDGGRYEEALSTTAACGPVWWNPADAAFTLFKKNFEFSLIYGNHDNYLIDPDVCATAKIQPRVRYVERPGVFIEHGHRLEATFTVGNGYNYDGCVKGYELTCSAYKGASGKGSFVQGLMGSVGKPISNWWAKQHDQSEYIGEYAQVWLGRQSQGQLKPPHIFVIGHTHMPNLWEVSIDAYRT